LFLDGVFAEAGDGSLEFHPADPPSDEDVARLLATIRRRVLRLLAQLLQATQLGLGRVGPRFVSRRHR